MRKGGDWIEDYLKYTDNTEPPKIFREWAAVSTIASALERKCYLPWGIDDTIYPNLYVVLVAPPGKARKTTAMKPMIEFIRELGIKLAPKNATREALIKILDESRKESPLPNGGVMSHCSLTIASPELTVFLGHDNPEFLQSVADWYDCDDHWEYYTKTQGQNVMENIWVNLFGATTPSLIQRALPQDAVGGGLASRIIFVFEKKRGKIITNPYRTPTQHAQDRALKSSLITDLGLIHTFKGAYEMTPDCMDFWEKWYGNIEKDNPDLGETFNGYLSRRQTHARKLAMIMCASHSNDKKITLEDFKRGLSLLRRTEVAMPMTFIGAGGSRNAVLRKHLLIYIKRRKKVTLSDIYSDLFGYIESTTHLQDVLKMMREDKSITSKKIGDDTWITYRKDHKLHDTFGGDDDDE